MLGTLAGYVERKHGAEMKDIGKIGLIVALIYSVFGLVLALGSIAIGATMTIPGVPVLGSLESVAALIALIGGGFVLGIIETVWGAVFSDIVEAAKGM